MHDFLRVLVILLSLAVPAFAAEKYSDEWVRGMCRMPLVEEPTDITALPYLDVVPSGGAKEIREVFRLLNIQPDSMVFIKSYQMNQVIFYEWSLSPHYKINIMTAAQEAKEASEQDVILSLEGYGIRVLPRGPDLD